MSSTHIPQDDEQGPEDSEAHNLPPQRRRAINLEADDGTVAFIERGQESHPNAKVVSLKL